MDAEQLINAITPEAYERLLYAVETGKWPEGTPLSQQQRDSCMQAVMLYQKIGAMERQVVKFYREKWIWMAFISRD